MIFFNPIKFLKRHYIRSFLFLFIFLILSPLSFSSYNSLSTEDGLTLSFSTNGDINGIKIKENNLSIKEGMGGFYVKDMGLIPIKDFKNGSFESDKEWNFGDKWYRDWKEAHDGKWSVKLEMPGSKKSNSGELLSNKISVESERQHLFTFWIKIKRFKGNGLNIMINQYDKNGQPLKELFPLIIREPSAKEEDWFKVYLPFKTNKEASYISISFYVPESFGILWLDDIDISMMGDLEPIKLSGKVIASGYESLTYQGISEKGQFAVNATFSRNEDFIKVDGTVEDLSGNDRAIILSFRIPIDARGWVWWDDIHRKRNISEKECYNDYCTIGKERYFSKLPLSCINNPNISLSFALPLNKPRIFRISYCYEEGYKLEFDFGLSKDTVKFPRKANFSFLIYSSDPKWGMRSSLKKYYQIFPEFFKKRVKREGIWYSHLDLEKMKDPEDFGFMFDSTIGRTLLYDNMHKIYTFLYFQPYGTGFPWPDALKKDKGGISPEISYSEIKERLKDMAINKEVKFPWVPGRELNLGKAALNSAYEDENGRFYIEREAPYSPYLFSNPDPDIEGESYGKSVIQALDYLLAKPEDFFLIEKYAEKPFIDGCYIDSIVPWYWSDKENYRKEQFKYADIPLVFSYKTRRPIQLSMFSNYELISEIANSMHQKGKLMLGNIWACSHTFVAYLFDILGAGEYSCDQPDLHFHYLRALSYQKTLSFADKDLTKPDIPFEEKEKRLKKCLAYGVFPGTYSWGKAPWEMKEKIELPRELYKKYIPLIQRISEAGWEPITEATSSHLDILIERFGPSKSKDLYFTLRNTSDVQRKITLKINISSLGFSPAQVKNILIEELLTKKEIKAKHLGNSILTQIEIPGKDTWLLHISNKEGHLRRKLEDIKNELTILSHGEISTYKTKNLLSESYRLGGDADSILNYFEEGEALIDSRNILMKNNSQEQIVQLRIPGISVKGGEPYHLSLTYKATPFEGKRPCIFSWCFSLIYRISKTLSYGYLPDISVDLVFTDPDNKILPRQTLSFYEFEETNSWRNIDKDFIIPQGVKEAIISVKLESNMMKLMLKDLRFYPSSNAAGTENEIKLVRRIKSFLNENLRVNGKNLINLTDEILALLEIRKFKGENKLFAKTVSSISGRI